jgi:short-chain 2-methylacyl-CoA dehydrogenase
VIREIDLSGDQLELIEHSRKFGEKYILPRAPEYFESGEFPADVLEQMIDAGFMGVLAPREWGGGNIDTVTYSAMLEEIAHADMTMALTWQVHVLVTDVYAHFASASQKDEWMPRLVSGEVLGAIAMTEPGAGSDLRSARTRAVRDGSDWLINGSKMFITNSGTTRSDGMVVLARSGEHEDGRAELSTFIVPRDTPGLVIGKKIRKLGWRAMDTREIFFEDCRIPSDNLLGTQGKGLRQVLTGMDLGRIAFGSTSVGLAQACLDLALAYAKERVQFGQPISSFQAIQFRLAHMQTKIAAARALCYDAARLRDLDHDGSEVAASMAKLFASRVAVECADDAYHIFGGYGVCLEYPVARYYADAKMMEIGEGTSEMQLQYIARSLGCG